MSKVTRAINNILEGSNIDDTIDALLQERVVCRYVGPPMKRVRRGKTYYVRARMCTGQANPTVARRSSMAWKSGGARQRASISHRLRWRNFRPNPMRQRRLPGRRKRR